MKKILITGARGFLGKNLVEHLHTKANLLLPNYQQLDLTKEIAVKEFLNKHQPEVIIHSAGVGIGRNENQPNIIQENLVMFENLVKCSKDFGKLIFCGSGAVYDKARPIIKINEEEFGKVVPKDPYGIYKYKCAEKILESSNMVDLRMFGVFGKYEDYKTRFISNAICKALLNLPIQIFKNVKFEYLFVEDWVKIVEYFVLHGSQFNNYNVGNGKPVSLLEIAEKIKELFNPDLQIVVLSEESGNEYSCDVSRLTNELNNFEFTAMDESLKRLYNWYSQNLSQIDKASLVEQ